MTPSNYIGRFAPSPSGELHFGSLVTALGSYLQARAHQGHWWVRIEDIDPPREVPGAASHILRQLEQYGLHWDGEVLWQSQRHEAYRACLAWLSEQGLTYYCTCNRSRIQALGGRYDGHCRTLQRPARGGALRLRQHFPQAGFSDRLRGYLPACTALAHEDYIIHRRDGLFAYNLAVVVDDHFQGINEIVRGADLIDPTVRQISLYQQFGWPVPQYVHLPLVCSQPGIKISKQNHAPALPAGDPRPLLVAALHFLNQSFIEGWLDLTTDELLSEAAANWALQRVPLTVEANPAFSNGLL